MPTKFSTAEWPPKFILLCYIGWGQYYDETSYMAKPIGCRAMCVSALSHHNLCGMQHITSKLELQCCSQWLVVGEKIGCWIQTINLPNWWCKHSPHNFFLVPCWDCISKGQNWGFKLQGTFCHGKNLPLTQLLKNTLGSKSSLLQQLSEKGPSAAGRPKEGQPNKMHRSLLHEEGSAFIHQGSKKKRRNEEALCK